MTTQQPTSLFARAVSVATQALRQGSLQPIETTREIIKSERDHGLQILVKQAKPGGYKKTSSLSAAENSATFGPQPNKSIRFNVFKPYDMSLCVEPSIRGGSHALLLNKFRVATNHLLLLPNQFASQWSHVSLDDWEATFEVMSDLPVELQWLGFFNRGTLSGASQTHFHFQFVPSIAEEDQSYNFPMVPVLNELAAGLNGSDVRGQVPQFHFRHSLRSLRSITSRYESLLRSTDQEQRTQAIRSLAKEIFEVYQSMLRDDLQISMAEDATAAAADSASSAYITLVCATQTEFEQIVQQQLAQNTSLSLEQAQQEVFDKNLVEMHRVPLDLPQVPSYNLLFTSDWMLIVPRRYENYHGISVNSLGFLCSFFAKTDQEKEKMKNEGFLALLKHVAFPNGEDLK